ncbi:ATP-binding protein [Ruminococcus albus]|uniref:ATPase family associated with various cellular activities (AAA) n=1 Tax=Ruminococcus albus TaxID=1264 RepID=A0A1I1CUV0_RUMAL|nr:MoxR family ATPase [Ruminococcus albus]SFB66475.1 ATPase family associated with various cellular activities (AAA) [Ruminococcus albus]
MTEIKTSSMTVQSVDGMVKQLAAAYSSVINAGLPVRLIPSVMLWGAPGVGKSQGVRQLAERIEVTTGKSVIITDVRLLLFNPIDLRGIPTVNAERTLAIWLRPKIFQMDESEDVINILFLDEISAAPQSVQAAAYQITLDRTVGEHKLPENCIVIAAGNRVTDKSVTYKMPRALANRLCHFEIEHSFESWKHWAIASGINSKVLGFLTFSQSSLMSDNTDDGLAFTTPRTWEMVSTLLNVVSDDIESIFPMIAGCIGIGKALEFRSWCRVFDELPDIDGIFSGKMPDVPKNTDALYALTAEMTARACRCKEDMERIANSVRYAKKLPPEFAAMLLRDYMAFEDGFRLKLMCIPEFTEWLQKNGRFFTDAK